jgi:hypothetical protein
MPGYIRTTKEAVRAHWAAKGVDIDAKIVDHIERWRDSVDPGTTVSIFKMLVFDVECNCPAAGWVHTKKCRGFAHGMPIEIVMEHIFPPDGTPCAIKGVEGLTMHGPLIEVGLGLPRFIQKS